MEENGRQRKSDSQADLEKKKVGMTHSNERTLQKLLVEKKYVEYRREYSICTTSSKLDRSPLLITNGRLSSLADTAHMLYSLCSKNVP